MAAVARWRSVVSEGIGVARARMELETPVPIRFSADVSGEAGQRRA